jgi:hypothetical protein
MTIKLIAEYGETNLGIREFGEFATLADAKVEVDRLFEAGEWPEGWTAIAADESGEKFMYADTDEWESMKDWAVA